MLEVAISELPKKLSMYEAVEVCYGEQIRFIWSRAKEGVSVLVKCDKQIVPYLQGLLKKRLAAEGKSVAIIDGRIEDQTGQGPPPTRISAMIAQLRNLLHNTEPNKVFFLPYLDIITSTVVGGLTQDGKEIMTMIHENPLLVRIVFEDPDFPLPDLIAQAFPARTELLGIPRTRFSQLITSEEGRKFGRETVNLMQLYKYVSGLNPVRLREITAIFAKKADFDPGIPDMLQQYLQELRGYTACGGVSLSHVNLSRDIAGYDKVKQQIEENILSLLRRTAALTDEKQIRALEGIIPRGLIFHGPPGTGKTLFAKGIAEALDAAIYIVSGPELKSKWVGEGEANIRRLFARARATAPSVIVFDELDSIAAARGGQSSDGASQAAHSMVNQLLTEMDGFRKEELVLIIGTTNFVSCLDPAFLRPGRFEFQIEIPYPESDDRRAILGLYNSVFGLGLAGPDLDFLAEWTGRLAETGTPHSGDHLNALMRSFKRHLLATGQESASGEILRAWLESRHPQTRLDRAEERVVALHEIGHLLMYARAGRTGDIQKVTLESGATDTLGFVQSRSRRHDLFFTETHLRDQMCICLGGYAAERLIFNEVSTGASGDLKQATAIANDMVALYGMGGNPVPRHYGDDQQQPHPYFLPTLAPRVEALLVEALREATAWLAGNREILDRLTEFLQDKRTLTPDQLREHLKGFEGKPVP